MINDVLKQPYIKQLEDIELRIESEIPKKPQKTPLSGDEQKYADIMIAEAGIQSDYISWGMFTIIIFMVGYTISVMFNQLYLGVTVSSILLAFAGFRLTGITIAWGIIHAKKCELAEALK